jgi:hypothetical protein
VPLEPLPPLFHQLNREHFEGSLARDDRPLVALRWSDGRLTRTAGLYRRWGSSPGEMRSEILLSRPLLDPLPGCSAPARLTAPISGRAWP